MSLKLPTDRFLIIGISGKQRAGKDTLADLLIPECEKSFEHFGQRAYKIGFASELKRLAGDIYGLDFNNEEIKVLHREKLILIGNKLREIEPHFWINALEKIIPLNARVLLIPDLRFVNEFKWIMYDKAGISIRIETDKLIRAKRGALSSEDNVSETELDEYSHGFTVTVNGGLSKEQMLSECLRKLRAKEHEYI